MSPKLRRDPAELEPWLVAQLAFEGDWATLHVPDLVERSMAEGFRQGDVRDLLLRWLRDQPDYVAPVLTSAGMIEFFYQSKHHYLRTPSGAYVSHLRVHRGLVDRDHPSPHL